MGLEQKHRQGILLSYVHGFSQSEIAERLALPLGTIKSWMRRGMIALKTCLGA
jgi:RNA polymerase sigma-70 factor (ECF subfamily)